MAQDSAVHDSAVLDGVVHDSAVHDSAVHDAARPAVRAIELRTGLWMLKSDGVDDGPGVIRGYVVRQAAPDGIRFVARQAYPNPTEGPRLGEFSAWERAARAVVGASLGSQPV